MVNLLSIMIYILMMKWMLKFVTFKVFLRIVTQGLYLLFNPVVYVMYQLFRHSENLLSRWLPHVLKKLICVI